MSKKQWSAVIAAVVLVALVALVGPEKAVEVFQAWTSATTEVGQ